MPRDRAAMAPAPAKACGVLFDFSLFRSSSPTGADTDGDGVGDETENATDNDGDANGDGTPDSQQPHVASPANVETGRPVRLEPPSGTALARVQSRGTPAGNVRTGVLFPLGFVGFEVRGIAAGAAVVVTMALPPGVRVNKYFQYGPTAQDTTPHFYEFPFDGTSGTGAEFLDDDGDGMTDRVALHFVDGGRGDADLAANGVIVDPGAPGTDEPGKIKGRVFEDANGNGVRDTDEPLLAGRTVFLDRNGNGLLDAGEPSKQTGATGRYRFANVAPGPHRVLVVPMSEW